MSLPRTPAFGFGVSGPLATPLLSDQQVLELVHHAHDVGVRFFDTAPLYGNGLGERRLGKALGELPRHDLTISTKVGVFPGKRRDFSPQAITNSVDDSLRRMRLEHVDVLFLHGPDPSELNDELRHCLEKILQAGKARAIGVAGRGPELQAALQVDIISFLMLPMGPGNSNADIATTAQQTGRMVYGIEMLAGTKRAGLPGSAADWWHWMRWILRGPAGVGSRDGKTALRTALQTPCVDVVLSSSSKKKHLDQWQQALDELSGNP